MLDKRKRSKLDFSKLFSCLRYCIYYIPILQLYWFSENLSAVSQVSAFISSNLIRTSKIIFLCKKNGEIYVLRLHKKISWNITSRYLTVLRRKCRLREFDQREVFIFFLFESTFVRRQVRVCNFNSTTMQKKFGVHFRRNIIWGKASKITKQQRNILMYYYNVRLCLLLSFYLLCSKWNTL